MYWKYKLLQSSRGYIKYDSVIKVINYNLKTSSRRSTLQLILFNIFKLP